ncbi:hypothetical protein DKX15_20705, partial [Enterococcus faecium]
AAVVHLNILNSFDTQLTDLANLQLCYLSRLQGQYFFEQIPANRIFQLMRCIVCQVGRHIMADRLYDQ